MPLSVSTASTNQDIDECALDKCELGERCTNTMGSFTCVSACEAGFKFNSRSDSCEARVYIPSKKLRKDKILLSNLLWNNIHP